MRTAISKRLRFEVLKRDCFTCQYCGAKAPNAVLNVDHIMPVASGGDNDLLNLVTSCADCNSGKSDKHLSDDAVIRKQQAQLEALQQRREQLKMMAQWSQELGKLNDEAVQIVAEHVHRVHKTTFTDDALELVRKMLKKNSVQDVIEAFDIAMPRRDPNRNVWKFLHGILRNKQRDRELPGSGRIDYVRGIIRNRFDRDYYGDIRDIQEALKCGVLIEDIERIAKTAFSYNVFLTALEDLKDSAMHVGEKSDLCSPR